MTEPVRPFREYASEEWERLERSWTARDADPLTVTLELDEPAAADGRVEPGWLIVVAVLAFCAGVVVGRWAA